MFSAAIVSSRNETASQLEACLLQTGIIGSIRRWSFSATIGQGEAIPDLVILDVSRDAENRLAAATQLRELRSNVLILAWDPSQQPTAELVLGAMRRGVRDFLPPAFDAAALRNFLACAVRQAGVAKETQTSKLIVVAGAKGGVGTTTVAVNLGVQLAGLTQKRVILLDFARPLGHVPLFLDLHPQFSVRDSVENLERLDEHLFAGLLARHKSGLGILAGAAHPDDWTLLPVSSLARVASVAQRSSEFVVVDLSGVFWPAWNSVLSRANTLILVAQGDAINVRSVERHVSAMSSLGVAPERLQIVINRWHGGDNETLDSLEEKTKCSILACLPNNFPRMNEAITQGTPLSPSHSVPLTDQFERMARELAGLTLAAGQRKHSTERPRQSVLRWLRRSVQPFALSASRRQAS